MPEMTAAISPPFNARAKQNKPPSFSSESPYRRPKTRDVPSRYLGGTSSSSLYQSSPSSAAKRCQSPTVTRTNRPVTPSSTTTTRPQLSGWRQLATPRRDSLDRRGSGQISSAQRILLSSGRSLFASFQVDSFTGNENTKLNSSSLTSARRGTVEKRKSISTTTSTNAVTQQEKSKLSEQWPRSLQPSSLSRSVDFTDTRKKQNGSGNAVTRALPNSMVNNRPISRERITRDSSSVNLVKIDSSTVEAERISSGGSNGRGKKLLARGNVAKPRFSQLTISLDNPALSPIGVANTRTQLFPKSEQIRPASPSKFGITAASSSPKGTSIARGISPSRGVIPPRGISPSGRMSPLRVRSSLIKSTPLVLNFAVETKKENGFVDAHLLRLLHNRLLHWRFVNARANAVVSAQIMRAERRVYNTWISIYKRYDSARVKRIELQHLKQNLKLIAILNKQMGHLEQWLVMDRNFVGSIVGAAEALKGSTLCLPVDCGAMVNVQSVKDAICSAVDVMQAMASSICLLLPKGRKISCLAAELGRVNVKEEEMLNLCCDLLNTISVLQVKECSLRTQSVQRQYSKQTECKEDKFH